MLLSLTPTHACKTSSIDSPASVRSSTTSTPYIEEPPPFFFSPRCLRQQDQFNVSKRAPIFLCFHCVASSSSTFQIIDVTQFNLIAKSNFVCPPQHYHLHTIHNPHVPLQSQNPGFSHSLFKARKSTSLFPFSEVLPKTITLRLLNEELSYGNTTNALWNKLPDKYDSLRGVEVDWRKSN